MDLGEKEKRAIDSLNLASAEWNQTSMVDSFIWNQPMCWNPSDSLSKGGMFLSAGQGLSQFPCDTGFTEKASRISSLNRSALVDPVKEKREKAGIDFSEPEFSEDGREESPNSSVFGSNKRKRSCQILELDRGQATLQLPLEIAKEEKNSTEMENAPKEDYIHVRARRGQATNSHSLAERVRREKISERMKFLQDLVPGCSKVTGKAVMLDEIINYVQSLQRQVEFLSMKLAAVNPSTDFNIESIISKDVRDNISSWVADNSSFNGEKFKVYVTNSLFLLIFGSFQLFQNRFGSSSAVGFAPEMIRQQLQRPPHQGLIQVGIPGVMNPSDAFRRALNVQLPSGSEYKEAAQQVCNEWDEVLHNVVQMTYGNNPPHKTQDLNGVPRDSFPL